jgi:hypothetical protein
LVGPARISLNAVLPNGDISAARTGPRVLFTSTAQSGLVALVWAVTLIPMAANPTTNNLAKKHFIRTFIFSPPANPAPMPPKLASRSPSHTVPWFSMVPAAVLRAACCVIVARRRDRRFLNQCMIHHLLLSRETVDDLDQLG